MHTFTRTPPPPPLSATLVFTASLRQIEYVADDSSVLDGAQMDAASLEEFKQIFERFTKVADEASGAAADAAEAEAAAAAAAAAATAAAAAKGKKAGAAEDEEDSDEEGAGPRLSRKARKLKSRLSVAELKQLVQRPDVVEAHDVTAADPRMLVFLKVCRRGEGGVWLLGMCSSRKALLCGFGVCGCVRK